MRQFAVADKAVYRCWLCCICGLLFIGFLLGLIASRRALAYYGGG
jgi:hypothetical protein